MSTAPRVLIVEHSVADAMELILRKHGYAAEKAGTEKEALATLSRRPFNLVFADVTLPHTKGAELISQIKTANPETELIVVTASFSADLIIEAIKRGAFYYLKKPFTADQLLSLTERVLRSQGTGNDPKHRRAVERIGDFGMVGRSYKMEQTYETIRATAESELTVMIEGESGTGKELIARAYHSQGHRSRGPFIRINCAAIPVDLIESELFGFRRGAFTGADRDKRGLMEAASGGTLFLDEIAEMPSAVQTKLLRVLQERTLRRLGDEREIRIDFRLICATNRNATDAVRKGFIRHDLYYRISTIKLVVPPLRERLGDLELLAAHFLRLYGAKYARPVRSISDSVRRLLLRHDWPGNVRELENVIEHSVLFCRGTELIPENLPSEVREPGNDHTRFHVPADLTMLEIEQEVIRQTLDRTGGNVKKTAEILHLHRPTLYRKLKKFGMKTR